MVQTRCMFLHRTNAQPLLPCPTYFPPSFVTRASRALSSFGPCISLFSHRRHLPRMLSQVRTMLCNCSSASSRVWTRHHRCSQPYFLPSSLLL